MHVVFAAGGTAGHLEPALNTADALVRKDPATTISFLGGRRGLEGELVPARGYPLVRTSADPLPRHVHPSALMFPVHLLEGVRDARAHVRASHADVVVGFGGYAAVPGYLAARSTSTPLVIHEANSRAGFANVLGARLTPHVASVHPGVLPHSRHVGLPLRTSIAHLDRSSQRDTARAHWGIPRDVPLVFVFGGSQGARSLNSIVAESIEALTAQGVHVLHAVGRNNPLPASTSGYVPVPYVERMDLAYAAADVAVCRSGAMTCAELTAVGLPAIYVPLPIGNGEQAGNSQPIIDAGGGLQIRDRDLTAEWLVGAVTSLVHDEGALVSMSQAATSMGERQADREMAEWIHEVAQSRRG